MIIRGKIDEDENIYPLVVIMALSSCDVLAKLFDPDGPFDIATHRVLYDGNGATTGSAPADTNMGGEAR